MSTKKVLVQREATDTGTVTPRATQPAEYLATGWFPYNTALLKEVKQRLGGGAYEGNRGALIEDLKRDFSLLSYCLRELRDPDLFVEHPMRVLEIAPLSEFYRILSNSESAISPHSFSDLLKPQALRFKHSMISCTTAEALAEMKGIDPGHVFGVALIRQLGLNLVAFNYPRIYTKAVQLCANSGEDLESILFRNLGFLPRQIGVKLSVAHMTPDLKLGLGLETESVSGAAGLLVSKFCELSEAFAQVNDPEHYPSVTRRWKSVTSELTSILGPKAMGLLKERLDGVAGNYSGLPFRIYDGDLSVERCLDVANRKVAEVLFSANPAATKVAEEIQLRLKKAYSLMIPGQVSPEALQVLVADCIPSAGFEKGCVYIFDNSTQALIPKLRIGERALEAYKTMQSTSILHTDNPILESLQSSVPVKRDGALLFGERVSLVAGMIGNNEKTGVLYLEMGEELAKDGGFDPVQRFKAIRHCLNLCLNLQQGPYQ